MMERKRKLFCEISPFTYKLSLLKCRVIRHVLNFTCLKKFAITKSNESLPVLVYRHKSLIRRKLGNVDVQLQNNKAVNLNIAAPKVSNVMIRPGECFSFWKLVGSCTVKKGYKEGLTISNGQLGKDVGGGMCQFTNLIHWMILHTPMQIVEHHHHDGMDLFPDYGRQIPFGVGTSIMYNYLDYRFINPTEYVFQLIVYTTSEYLCGELRADKELPYKYHIKLTDEFFSKEADGIFRNNCIYRECYDKKTGNLITKELMKRNHAKVMYDTSKLLITERTA
ncbi:VanW family protein [Clostridium sp. KNHs216]|uniref:VanW family protein n=1 Tax=Clostridium sp. KNHs216 TaxID=1550235 RepID=UPI001FAA1D14|nr:VanW family protein [Clostridium sp. KNHs216]